MVDYLDHYFSQEGMKFAAQISPLLNYIGICWYTLISSLTEWEMMFKAKTNYILNRDYGNLTCLAPWGFWTVWNSRKSLMSESDEYTKSIIEAVKNAYCKGL